MYVCVQAMGAMKDKSQMESSLRQAQEELGNEKSRKMQPGSSDGGDMENKMAALKSQMEQVFVYKYTLYPFLVRISLLKTS